jgi:hypothetical protein
MVKNSEVVSCCRLLWFLLSSCSSSRVSSSGRRCSPPKGLFGSLPLRRRRVLWCWYPFGTKFTPTRGRLHAPHLPEVWCHRCRRLTPMEARWGAPLPIPPCWGSPSLPPLRGCPRPPRATTPQGIAPQRGTALRGGRSSRRA